MADKNLHDIKIDEAETKKKTPLKNILTLLALLFVILVISVVITKLILNTDDVDSMDSNYTSEQTEEGSSSMATAAGVAIAGAAGTIAATANSASEGTKNAANGVKDATNDGVKNSATEATKDVKNAVKAPNPKDVKNTVKAPNINNALKERETSGSKTKVTLRDHQPVKTVKELKHTTSSTKKAPTKTSTSTKSSSHKNTDKVVKRNSSSSSKHSVGSTVSKLSHGFYIKIGTYKNTKTAVSRIKKTGLDYKLVKTSNGLTRVYIGRFSTKGSAQSKLKKAKTVNPSAFIYEEK